MNSIHLLASPQTPHSHNPNSPCLDIDPMDSSLHSQHSLLSSKPMLASTYDGAPTLQDTFTHGGHTVTLSIYQNKLICHNNELNLTICFTSETIFEMVAFQGVFVGFRLLGKNQYLFQKEFWPAAEQWRRELLLHIKQSGFHEFFQPIKRIGKGNFASVYLAQDLFNGQQVAVKAFVKEVAYKGNGIRALNNQIALLRRCDSENIAKLHGVYESANSVYLVMEYVEGVTLQNYIRTQRCVSSTQKKLIITSILKALAEMASKGVLHRDIKPDNIIVSKQLDQLKIVDFGLATDISETAPIFLRCGTPGYVAPQILKMRDNEPVRLYCASDVFSVGCIMYLLTHGRALFHSHNHQEVLSMNRACRITLPERDEHNRDEVDLLLGMLDSSPRMRLTAENALKSQYLSLQSPVRRSHFTAIVREA